jgi:hypothetical protein
MPTDATFESFEKELNRLVESFGKRLTELKQPGYAEAQLRDDFLNPFFRALGWDMENRAGLIQREREVEIESATQILPPIPAHRPRTLGLACTGQDCRWQH